MSRNLGASLRPQVACQHDHFQVVAILRHVGLRRKLKIEQLVGNHTSFFFFFGDRVVSQARLQPPNRHALLCSS